MLLEKQTPNIHKPTQPPTVNLITSIPNITRDPLNSMAQIAEENGDMVRLDFGLAKVYLLSHPKYIQHVMRDNQKNYLKKSGMWQKFRIMFGNGLPVNEGEPWKRQRRMLQPQFHRQYLGGLTGLMIEAVEEFLQQWDAAADSGETVDVDWDVALITMKVFIRSMFSNSITSQEVEELATAIKECMAYIQKQMWTFFFPDWFPRFGQKNFAHYLSVIDRITYRVITERRKQDVEIPDLISLFVTAVDEETNEGMSDEQARDEAISMYTAGYETTAATIAWALYFLCKHPEAMQNLQAEADRVFGDSRPMYEQVNELVYSRMVFEETLRLCPPVWMLPRDTQEDDQIDGYHIPAGAPIITLFYRSHRHPEFWENPEIFDPQRFAPEKAKDPSHEAFMPFSVGPRMCVGKNFAMIEGPLVLSMIARRYEIEAVEIPDLQLKTAVTLQPPQGLKIKLHKRP